MKFHPANQYAAAHCGKCKKWMHLNATHDDADNRCICPRCGTQVVPQEYPPAAVDPSLESVLGDAEGENELQFVDRFPPAMCNIYKLRRIRGMLRSELASAPFYGNLELYMRGKTGMHVGKNDAFFYERDVFNFLGLWFSIG